MEARRERPGRMHSGRSHAVARPGTRIGSRPPAAAAAVAAGHGHCPPRQRRSLPAPGRRGCRPSRGRA
eukprot:12360537-Alexandrium_andersonii.AAC.1